MIPETYLCNLKIKWSFFLLFFHVALSHCCLAFYKCNFLPFASNPYTVLYVCVGEKAVALCEQQREPHRIWIKNIWIFLIVLVKNYHCSDYNNIYKHGSSYLLDTTTQWFAVCKNWHVHFVSFDLDVRLFHMQANAQFPLNDR